jgi:hypothetical protein
VGVRVDVGTGVWGWGVWEGTGVGVWEGVGGEGRQEARSMHRAMDRRLAVLGIDALPTTR